MKRNAVLLVIILIFAVNLAVAAPIKTNNSAIFYYNAGVNDHKQGRIELAIQNYRKALSLDPKMTDARYNLGIAYEKLAINYFQSRNYNLAIQNYKNALTIEPKNAEIYYNLGIIYGILGQSDLSIANYQKAAGLNPKMSGINNNLVVNYYNAGVDCYKKGEPDQAIENYNKALSINPRYIPAYDALSNIYSHSGQIDLAIASYEKLASLKPFDATNYYNLGVSYGMKGLNDKAVLNYEKALKINPEMADAQNNLKILLKDQADKVLAANIDAVKAPQKAPERIYRMVSLERGLKYTSMIRMYEILDLIWSDPEGQKLLDIVCRNNIPIKITPGMADTDAVTQVKHYKESMTFIGIPIMSYDVGTDKTTSINIGENFVLSLRNQSMSADLRVRGIESVVHEMCHAVRSTLGNDMNNGLEEELSASMIGYNVAYRVIEGRELNEDETADYSKRILLGLYSDDHRNLPTYNGFNNFIQTLGIHPPHLYVYQNINALYDSIEPQYKNSQNSKAGEIIIGN